MRSRARWAPASGLGRPPLVCLPHLNLRSGRASPRRQRLEQCEGAVANGGEKWTAASSPSSRQVGILKVGSCLRRRGSGLAWPGRAPPAGLTSHHAPGVTCPNKARAGREEGQLPRLGQTHCAPSQVLSCLQGAQTLPQDG